MKPENQILTIGIVLSRIDFQEADRILTFLTPDFGKQKVIAKGVRRPRSKLAGGIELLSVSNITILRGRGELGTLVSSRLITHYGNIVRDIRRTMLSYELLKRMNRITEDATEPEYFSILQHTLQGLNDLELAPDLVELWFTMQLLFFTGHAPNLKTDSEGNPLEANKKYLFDIVEMAFRQQKGGPFSANHIKLLRLAYAAETPDVLKQLKDASKQSTEDLKLAQNILRQHVRV